MAKKIPNRIDVEIGARIRMRRVELGMSQEALGDAVGLTFQQVQKYEKGKNRCSGSRLHQVAKALKTTPGFLVGGDGAKDVPASDVVQLLQRPDVMRLVRGFAKVTDVT